MGDVCNEGAKYSGSADAARQTRADSKKKDMTFLLAGVTDQLNDPIITTDLDFKITYVNRAFSKIFGYTPDEVLGKSPGIFNADNNSKEIQNDIYQTVKAGKVWKGEVLNRRKDGNTFPCELVISPLKDENGKIIAYSGMQRNITLRKESEVQVRQEIQIRERILEKLPCIAMVLERGTRRIVASNEAARKIGADVGEFCYEKCSLLPDPCTWCLADEIWDDDETKQREIEYQGTNYEGQWAALTDDLYVHYIFDITKRKAAEETLKRHSLRSDILLELSKMRDSTKEDILAFTRQEVTRITDSEVGFIGFLSDDESTMKVESWSRRVMAKCSIDNKPIVFSMSNSGKWAESIRQRKPVIYNEFTIDSDDNPVLPEGHIPITRFMTIPVFDGDRIVMVAAAANKKTHYDGSDVSAMTSMMEDVWRLLRQKDAEDALRLSEEKFSKVFHSSPDSVTLTNIDTGKFLEVNKGFVEMSGYTRDEVIGKTTLDVNLWRNPAYRDDMIKEFREKGSLRDYEIQGVNKKGKICDCMICCELIEIDSAPCLLSITRDITESKRVLEAHRLSEEKFLKAFHNSPDSIAIVRVEDGLILEVNKGFEKIFGYSHDQAIGKTKVELKIWENAEAREVLLRQYEEKGRVSNLETRVFDKAGNIHYCLLSCERIDIDGEACFVSIARDITERKRDRQQLEVAKEHAEAANAAKSEFLANMSHEIRTPISVIKGFSDMLASEELTKQQAAYVELIRNASKSLLVIINDILDYSKIEAGKLDIIVSEHSLEDIVDVVDRMMRPQAVEKGLRFEVIWDRKLPDMVNTDQVRLHECLTNLVSNAIKFTDSGFVFLKVASENRNDQLLIRFDIEDSGIGIPADEKDNIFDSFSQVEKGSTRYFGGAGLGLAITGRLAGLLGGTVSVASEEGKGSTFTLTIPAGIRASEDNGEVSKSRRKIVDVKKETPKFIANVLVAEDHQDCQMIIRRMLEMYGLNVSTADDGKEAVEKVLGGNFDLVFMDIRMPEYNGFEATDILRQKDVYIPIIALTAHAMKGDSQRCIDAGFSDYLSKPVERDKLLNILRRYAGSEVKKV